MGLFSPSKLNFTRRRMIRNREFIKDYKKDKKCEICGYNKYTKISIFHHKEGEEKNNTVSNLMKSLKNLDTIKKEIDECIILCPDCHRELYLKKEKNN